MVRGGDVLYHGTRTARQARPVRGQFDCRVPVSDQRAQLSEFDGNLQSLERVIAEIPAKSESNIC